MLEIIRNISITIGLIGVTVSLIMPLFLMLLGKEQKPQIIRRIFFSSVFLLLFAVIFLNGIIFIIALGSGMG